MSDAILPCCNKKRWGATVQCPSCQQEIHWSCTTLYQSSVYSVPDHRFTCPLEQCPFHCPPDKPPRKAETQSMYPSTTCMIYFYRTKYFRLASFHRVSTYITLHFTNRSRCLAPRGSCVQPDCVSQRPIWPATFNQLTIEK